MKDFPIPVRGFGPGSQPAEEELAVLGFSRDVPTFSMPQVPEGADAGAMAAARSLLAGFVDGMAGGGTPSIDLAGVDPAALEILNQTLGEGEVRIKITAHFNGTREVRVQETVFAGIWRELHFDAAGLMQHDWLLAAPVPPIVLEATQRSAAATLPTQIEVPEGAMNAPALLTEIREHVRSWRPGQPAHVINLTLLPVSPADHALLESVLPVGPVAMISQGFGNCRITSTGVRHVWRVQYFNSMQTLILNTIEVVGIPEVALAAEIDLADSRERLQELLDWMADPANA
jgi:hydrogenase-1 operon protein HyaF